MDQDWIMLLRKNQMEKLMEVNRKTEQYGLSLSQKDAELILQERVHTLRNQGRVEFGEGIIEKIIDEFCDSAYMDQDHYTKTLIRLQEFFYLYKNEMMDEISDEELLHFMKEQYESICFGDLDYLEGTCLNNFAQAIRAGYQGHRRSCGYGEYGQFDEVKRWDYDLYLETLKDLCWR